MVVTREDYEDLYRRTNYAQIPRKWFDEQGRIKAKPNGAWHRRLDFVLSWRKHMDCRGAIYDIGCGASIPKKILWTHHGIDVVGVDFAAASEPDIVADITRTGTAWTRVGDVAPRESFVCFDVLEHIYDDGPLDHALQNLSSLFNRGGIFTIAYGPERRKYGQREQLHVTLQNSLWWGSKLSTYWSNIIHIGKKLWAVSSDSLQTSWYPKNLLVEHYRSEEFAHVWFGC